MQTRALGRSGCAVSALALGTMTFGAESDEATSFALLDTFVTGSGTLIDTADVYSAGVSEEIIGRWLRNRPADVTRDIVLATKGRFPMGADANDVGLSRRHLRRALEDSLRRLGVDHVDLYQVHGFDPATPLEETFGFLDDVVSRGQVSYVGLSNYAGWQVQKAVDLAEHHGLAVPVTLQSQYSLLVREVEWEIVPACASTGLGLLPWGPVGGGWLTGKYRRDQQPTGATRLGEAPERGVEHWGRRSTQARTWDVLDTVVRVAQARGCTPSEVSIAWLLARPQVSSVVLGARNTAQLIANLPAGDLVLSDTETDALDAASDPSPADYPYGTFGEEQRSRRIAA